MDHLSSLTLDRFFSEQLPVYQELLSSEKEPKREFSVKTVDEYLIKNPVDIRVGYILCRHNFGQNAIVRPWSIIWAFFHHIENNSDDKNKYFHKGNRIFFAFKCF